MVPGGPPAAPAHPRRGPWLRHSAADLDIDPNEATKAERARGLARVAFRKNELAMGVDWMLIAINTVGLVVAVIDTVSWTQHSALAQQPKNNLRNEGRNHCPIYGLKYGLISNF